MRNLFWIIAWLCVGLWTAVAALGYWVIGAVTGFAANNADKVGGDAQTVEFINWLALLLGSVGEVAAVILWAIIHWRFWASPGSSPSSPASHGNRNRRSEPNLIHHPLS